MTSKDEITPTQPNSPQSQAPKDETKSTQPNSAQSQAPKDEIMSTQPNSPQPEAPKDESTSSQPNSQPQAPIPNAESTEISGIAGEQPPENRENNSISPDEERSTQQGVSHRASVNSHTQDSERMAGTFPDEDNESIYSSAALEDQHDTNFHAPVEGNALHDNESIYSSAALEDQHDTNFHAPIEGNALHGSEGTIDSDRARQAESQGRHSSETAKELGTRATPVGNQNTSSEAPTTSIATEGPTEVDRTNESGQIDFTSAARDDNEELLRGPEAEEAESSRSTVDPSSNDQAGPPHDKQRELPPSGAKQDAVDAVSVAESETPSDRTAYRGSKAEPAEVIKRVSIPDNLVPRQPSVSTRKSSKAAKKVTLPPPKIFVQSPSDVTDQDITEPHPTPAAQLLPNDEYRIISRHGSIVSVQHTVNSAAEKLKRPRIRRRKLYIRKARNLAARPVFLNAALGRRVGRQTKERLRRLAKGEDVQSTSIKTQANPPDAPRLRKSQSFIRKARNLVARKSFLDMALGREVSSDTKPVLRQMASGRFSIVEDGQVSEGTR